jgi:predicted MFS family arabinose efflux permease
MNSADNQAALPAAQNTGMSTGLTAVFAAACGIMVANVYYAQPLIAPIGHEFGLPESLTGLIVTITQLGYAAGLLLVVPLGDLVENRRLILTGTGVAILGMLGIAAAPSMPFFLASSFLVGIGSVAAQVLVPFAAHLAPERSRGRVIGNVMAGLLAGIMLARPAASFMAAHFGWRSIFVVSAVLLAAAGALLAATLPERHPNSGLRYPQILRSIGTLIATLPALRRRIAYQCLIFASFQMFWTAVPLVLAQKFGLSQSGIALFALAGAGGALSAPIAGRAADRGLTRIGTAASILVVIGSFALAGWAGAALVLVALVIAGVTLDSATQFIQILNQRTIYSLAPEARGRINSAYMTIAFTSGAVGSTLGSLTFAYGGWPLTCCAGALMGLVVLTLFATEFLPRNKPDAKP